MMSGWDMEYDFQRDKHLVRVLTIKGFNPVPWTVGTLGTGRKGGKVYPTIAKAGPLVAFQTGVHEDVSDFFSEDAVPLHKKGTLLQVEFYFWRQLETIQIKGGRKRKARRADATNCSKALEDAMQAVIYHNDVDNVAPLPFMIEQTPDTEPGLIVVSRRWTGQSPAVLANWKELRADMLKCAQPITYSELTV